MYASFDRWTGQRSVAAMGTNAGSAALPFQRWRHFKEAFAPEIVRRAVAASAVPVRCCVDPFGGSGTTALACQFLGIRPLTVEVNPYLADLIEAKLTSYDNEALIMGLGHVLRAGFDEAAVERDLAALPSTFVQPGINGRWLFDRPVAVRLISLAHAIASLPEERERRLFRVLLGGIMLGVSNAVVNGKGRRYRRGWNDRCRLAGEIDAAFANAATAAIADLDRFARRRELEYWLVRGDCRETLAEVGPFDLAVFSPPYPNSFDYTDVYNLELWMLGYLRTTADNRRLRAATLSSHVQVQRNFVEPPPGSSTLGSALEALRARRDALWDRRIPEMVGAYFADLLKVMGHVGSALTPGSSMWMVVGDSRYANVSVRTADILCELVPLLGLELVSSESLRDMRVSPQQGGQPGLAESLVVARRP